MYITAPQSAIPIFTKNQVTTIFYFLFSNTLVVSCGAHAGKQHTLPNKPRRLNARSLFWWKIMPHTQWKTIIGIIATAGAQPNIFTCAATFI